MATGHEHEIPTLVDAGEAAWAGRDATWHATLFAGDVEFISPHGTVCGGRRVVKQRGEWLILGQQMTPVPPLP